MNQNQQSKAYKTFKVTYLRAEGMLNGSLALLDDFAPDPKPADWSYNHKDAIMLSDMGRASIIIAVSAFDDYFTRRFSESVVPFLKGTRPKDGLIKFLEEEAKMTVDVALSLLKNIRPYKVIRKIVDDALELRTMQKFQTIDKLFLCFNLNKFSKNVEKNCGRKQMCTSISSLIQRRHEIAHSGDLTRTGKLQRIDPPDTLKRIQLMDSFISSADEIINNAIPN